LCFLKVSEIPPEEWTVAQMGRTITRMCEVQVFFMRGTPEARGALSKFQKLWEPYVLQHPEIIELLDPEVSFLSLLEGDLFKKRPNKH
jgi:hypothetical protein